MAQYELGMSCAMNSDQAHSVDSLLAARLIINSVWPCFMFVVMYIAKSISFNDVFRFIRLFSSLV
jgi:hypothetical protein